MFISLERPNKKLLSRSVGRASIELRCQFRFQEPSACRSLKISFTTNGIFFVFEFFEIDNFERDIVSY